MYTLFVEKNLLAGISLRLWQILIARRNGVRFRKILLDIVVRTPFGVKYGS